MLRNLRWRRLALTVWLPLALGGRPVERPMTANGSAFTQVGTALRHVASGMLFPASVDDFQRVTPFTYDAAGKDVSVGYNAGRPIVATVYIYPAPSLESFGSPPNVVADARVRLANAEFERRKREVTDANPGAVLVQERPVTLTQNNVSIDGQEASFTFTGDLGGQMRKLRSELFVFCFLGQTWALEYRISYPEEIDSRAEIDAFMRDLRLPFTR